jgi:hypothetical protein
VRVPLLPGGRNNSSKNVLPIRDRGLPPLVIKSPWVGHASMIASS